MIETPTRPAFYSLPAGSWRDYITILHPPYTLWHLSYVVLGVALGPTLHLERLMGTLLAFFLAVGIGAHALDELKGRPLRTQIPRWVLVTAAVVSISGATALGLFWGLARDIWLLPFTAFGAFIVIAYNLELLKGRFHSDFWFAAAWGSFPFLTAYWVNAAQLTAGAVLVAVACFLLSLAQRTLSKEVRRMRRGGGILDGAAHAQDIGTLRMNGVTCLVTLERVLQLLSTTIVILAAGLFLIRA